VQDGEGEGCAMAEWKWRGGHVSGDSVGTLGSAAWREGGRVAEGNRNASKMAGPGAREALLLFLSFLEASSLWPAIEV